MELRIYQIDAFASGIFEGNPASVVLLQDYLPDETLQQIAAENNQAETAFILPQKDGFSLRWFTPIVEVDLCGHATLAAAHALWKRALYQPEIIHFHTRSGLLEIKRKEDEYAMNFPADPSVNVPEEMETIGSTLRTKPMELYKGKTDYMAVVATQREIENLQPDFSRIARLPARGVIVTAPGNDVDFVSRCFYSPAGIDEDHVTGSAHTTMTPYWSKKLNKTELTAIQLSKRKGFIGCKDLGDRVEISGSAKTYMSGHIYI